MGRTPALFLGMLKSPVSGAFWLLGVQELREAAVGRCLQVSPCLHPDGKGVTEECLLLLQLPRSTPRSTSMPSKNGFFQHVSKLGTGKCLFIYYV